MTAVFGAAPEFVPGLGDSRVWRAARKPPRNGDDEFMLTTLSMTTPGLAMTAPGSAMTGCPPQYVPPGEIAAAWMEYYRRTERRWPTVRELAEASGLSRSRAGEYRRLFLAARETKKRRPAAPAS
jgi:hypothetical protein